MVFATKVTHLKEMKNRVLYHHGSEVVVLMKSHLTPVLTSAGAVSSTQVAGRKEHSTGRADTDMITGAEQRTRTRPGGLPAARRNDSRSQPVGL